MPFIANGSRICDTNRNPLAGIDVSHTLVDNTSIIIIAAGMTVTGGDEAKGGNPHTWQFRALGGVFENITAISAVRFADSTALVHNTLLSSANRRCNLGANYVQSGREFETGNDLTQNTLKNSDESETQVAVTFEFAAVNEIYEFQVLWEEKSVGPLASPVQAFVTSAGALIALFDATLTASGSTTSELSIASLLDTVLPLESVITAKIFTPAVLDAVSTGVCDIFPPELFLPGAATPIPNTNGSTNTDRYSARGASHIWWNFDKSRWDGILPQLVGSSDYYIITDIGTPTATFTSVSMAVGNSSIIDVIYAGDVRTVYCLDTQGTQALVYTATYDPVLDLYTKVVNGSAASAPWPARSVTGHIYKTPNGFLWTAIHTASGVMIDQSTDNGLTWLATPFNLVNTGDWGSVDLSHFSFGGNTFLIILIMEQEASAPAEQRCFIINETSSPTLIGSYSEEVLPAYQGKEGSYQSSALTRGFDDTIYGVSQTGTAAGATDAGILLYKRTAAGVWTRHVATLKSDGFINPSVTLDEVNGYVYIVCVSGTGQGFFCKAPLSTLVFEVPVLLFTGVNAFEEIEVPNHNVHGGSGLEIVVRDAIVRNMWQINQPLLSPPRGVQTQQNIFTQPGALNAITATLPVAATLGNLLVTSVGIDKTAGAITVPTGFTLGDSQITPMVSGAWAWKISDGTETVVSWSWATTTGNGATAWVGEYSGVNNVDVFANADSVTPTTTQDTGVTANVTNSGLLLSFWMSDTFTNVNLVENYTNEFIEIASSNSTGSPAGLHVAQRTSPVAGPQSSTLTTTDTGDEIIGFIVSFNQVASDIFLDAALTASNVVNAVVATPVLLDSGIILAGGVVSTLLTDISLAASLGGSSAITPTLTTQVTLSSVGSGESVVTPDLVTVVTLDSGLTAVSDVTSSLTTSITMSSALTGTAQDAPAELLTQVRLFSVVTGAGNTTAKFSVGLNTFLDSSITATTNVQGQILTDILVSALSSGSGDALSALTTDVNVTSLTSGTSTVFAELFTDISLSSLFTGSHNMQAHILTGISLGSLMTGSADVSATASLEVLLTAQVVSESVLTSELSTELNLTTNLVNSLNLQSNITTSINLTSSFTGELNLTPSLTTGVNLTSSLTGELNLTPSLTTDTRFNSLISGDQFIQSSLSTELNLTTNLSNVLNLTSSLTTELNLTTTASNSANITADLSVGQNIFLTASPVFESDISSDLSTGISLTASVVSNLEVTPVLETQTLLTALTSGTAVAGAQLQTVINLASQIVNNADTSSSLTVGSNVSSTIALSGSVSADLLTQVTLSAITDGGFLVTATIQTSVEMATALLGESDILAGSLIADTDFMTGVTASATITSGLFTGIALTSATFGEGFMSGDIVLVIPSVGTFTMSNVTITFSGMSGVTVTQSEMSKVSLTF